MKIRIKFSKYGSMKFIGHLDIMRYFQKSMRRSDIDISYTEGFSPHQVMSFAAPLGVGITSGGEYLDIEVGTSRTSREAVQALNEVMVEGIEVLEYKRLPEGAQNAMSLVAAADYTIGFVNGLKDLFTRDTLAQVVSDFLDGTGEILITKKTKKSERTLDIRPLIYEMKAVSGGSCQDYGGGTVEDGSALFLKLCTGSSENLKPELVAEALVNHCVVNGLINDSVPMDKNGIRVHRNEVYGIQEGRFLPLGDFGQEIEAS